MARSSDQTRQPLSVRLDGPAMTALDRLAALYGHDERRGAIEEAILGWERLLTLATDEVAPMFARQEWGYLADAMNGCLVMFQGMPSSPGQMLAMQAWDAHRLNDYGSKWLSDEDEEAMAARRLAGEANPAVEARVRSFVDRLAALTFAQGWAVIRACQYFWADAGGSNNIDHLRDEWWTLAYRRAGGG